jgi:alpha-galactosidase
LTRGDPVEIFHPAIRAARHFNTRPAVGENVAATPPMGWNSWDCYGTTVTEAEVKANADYMARHLKQHGWQYVVVDIQWSEPDPKAHGYRPEAQLSMDEHGRLIPAVNRFPSSAGGRGFRPLADYIHGLGLRFGIHIMRGIPRQAVKANLPVFGSQARAGGIADTASICPWNSDMYGVDLSRPGAQDYYDSISEAVCRLGRGLHQGRTTSRGPRTARRSPPCIAPSGRRGVPSC